MRFPVQIITIQVSDSSSSSSDRSELAGIICQCVREEIDLQRVGRQETTNILERTRDLIGNATTSVSREFDNTHARPSSSQRQILSSSSSTLLPIGPLTSTPNHGEK